MRAPDFVIHGDFSGPQPPPPPRVVGRNAPFGPSLNLFRRKDVPPPTDRGLLSFVKKVLNAGPALLRSVNGDEVIASFKRLASLVGNAAGIFGAGYIGVQLVSVMWKRLCEERERWRIRSSSEAFARATFEEPESDSSSSRTVGGLDGKKGGGKGGGRASSSSSTPSLEELHADQEEMWRVIHNIYKDQADKLAALESASVEYKFRFETVAREAEAALSLAMAKLTIRLEGLEGRCEAIAAIPVDTITAIGATGRPTAAELEALRNELRREAEKHASAISALRLEVPSLLEQHDKVVVSKLQQFGEDVKKLILAAGNRNNASAPPGASGSAVKPKSKSKPKPKPSP